LNAREKKARVFPLRPAGKSYKIDGCPARRMKYVGASLSKKASKSEKKRTWQKRGILEKNNLTRRGSSK